MELTPNSVAGTVANARANRPLLFGFGIAVVALVGIGILSYRSIAELEEASRWAIHTEQVLTVSEAMLSEFRQAQSERRAFLLTGDSYFLNQYRTTIRSADERRGGLRTLIRDNPRQRARIALLEQVARQATDHAEYSIRVRIEGGLEAAAEIVESRTGHELVAAVEQQVRRVQAAERELLAARTGAVSTRAQRTRAITGIGGLLAVIMILTAWGVVLRDEGRRREAAAAMRMARDQAESATRMKSEFLANMSHEIRTPMNGVIGMTELVLETRLDRQQREHLEMVRSSADSLMRVINDILDFSRIEAGRIELEAVPFRLREDLGDTLKTLALRAQDRHLELLFRVAPEVPEHLVGDLGRLRQILLNLVGNAIKFTEHGEVEVDVDLAAPVHADAAELHIAVRDTGIGIAADRQEAVFVAFTQADSSTTRRFGGTGIGLAISAQLVQLMGGRIWLESELGTGSTFHFSARFTCVDAAREPAARTDASLTDLRVLVVDDNATNRAILEEMLGNWGIRRDSAASGKAALERFADAGSAGDPYHLVLLDMQMPEMNGLDVAAALQTTPVPPRILVLSSSSRTTSKERVDSLGIAEYLLKPVKQSELLDAIMNAMARGSSAPATIAAPAQAEGRMLRILLAEDNIVNQRLALGILGKRGYAVTVAETGLEAISALEREPFDLVLMDLQMPQLGGLEATVKIRQWEADARARRIPIFAVTAHAMPGDRERCLAAGMDDYLTKPIRPDALFRMIDAHFPPTSGDVVESTRIESAGGRLGLDRAELLESLGGDPVLLDELIQLFAGDAPGLVQAARDAAAAGDAAALGRAAHKLKGSSSVFGQGVVTRQAADVELLAESGDLERASSAIPGLEQAVRELVNELRSLGARA